MKRNLLFNQATALGKRLAMVLTMLLIVGIGQAWGAEVTAINNIISGNTYYIKGVRSSSIYYLKFTDSSGSQKGTEVSTTNEAIPITFIAVSGGWHLKTPNGNYIAPGTSNGTINVSTTAITVTATDQSSKIRLSIVNNGTTWSIQKNTSAANFGGYKNTQADITLIETSASSPVNPTVTFSDGEYTIGGAALDLSTLLTTNSTGAVTYSVTDAGTTGATIEGSTFTATAAGTCTVQASQAATANYNAITKTATITVNAAAGGGGDGDCDKWVEVDLSDIQSTDDVVIAMEKAGTIWALPNNGGTSTPSAVVINSTNLASKNGIADALTWNIYNDNGTLTIYPKGSTSTWLYCNNSNDGVRVGTNANKTFTIDASSGYLKHTSTSRYVGVYIKNPDWRCYDNTTGNIAGQTLKFYKYVKCATETTPYLLRK